ncbi:MAG: galactokinase [Deltaproteobacteria bacterium]|nr:galactokinase [Deltaproteobacteria bacterium]
MSSLISVKEILDKTAVTASAPCRIDAGGTWDIKAMALSFERYRPVTFNVAINLRTTVTLLPYKSGRVRITSEGFSEGVECKNKNMDLTAPFSIFFAAVNYFGFTGLEIRISSASPVKSALGGSSTALTALIKALVKLDMLAGAKRALSRRDILTLGYHLEDGISGGNCGMQDQAAAVYGGVNGWYWSYSSVKSPVTREALLDRAGMKLLSDRIMVAYSGKWHVSLTTNRIWLDNFLNGKTRDGWLHANDVIKGLISAVRTMEWQEAARCIREEMRIRRKITPDALIPETGHLIKEAEHFGCGARFTGAGAGGSVWAIGAPDDVKRLKKRWEKSLSQIKGACILPCKVDPNGVK